LRQLSQGVTSRLLLLAAISEIQPRCQIQSPKSG
jgi:hypothetical protein